MLALALSVAVGCELGGPHPEPPTPIVEPPDMGGVRDGGAAADAGRGGTDSQGGDAAVGEAGGAAGTGAGSGGVGGPSGGSDAGMECPSDAGDPAGGSDAALDAGADDDAAVDCDAGTVTDD